MDRGQSAASWSRRSREGGNVPLLVCLCLCVCVRETMVSPPLVYSCPGVVPGPRPAPPPPGTVPSVQAATLPQRRTSESQTITITSKSSEHERGQVKTIFVTLKKHSTKCVDSKQSANFEMTNNTATTTCKKRNIVK